MVDYINQIDIMKLCININKLPIETIKIICKTFEINYNENVTILNKILLINLNKWILKHLMILILLYKMNLII